MVVIPPHIAGRRMMEMEARKEPCTQKKYILVFIRYFYSQLINSPIVVFSLVWGIMPYKEGKGVREQMGSPHTEGNNYLWSFSFSRSQFHLQ